MKQLFLILFSFFQFTAFSQLTCTVSPGDTTACFNDSIAFTTLVTGQGSGTVTYQWQRNHADMPGKTDSVLMFPFVDTGDTASYRCVVKSGSNSATSNDAFLRMHPKMKFDTLYRYNELGCRGVCKGQFKALVSGGLPPYTYNWGGGHSQDTIVFGLCPGKYWLFVTDSNKCTIDSSYLVDVLKSPKIELTVLPKKTVYLTNPTIDILFPDSVTAYLNNWTWDFRDSTKIPNVNPAPHTYANPGIYLVTLQVTDANGCDTVITDTVTVKVLNLFIPNVITPNADGYNDQLKFMEEVMEDKYQDIDLQEVYIRNEFVVYDRWGKVVYNRTNYINKDWDGGNLSDGVYYYVFRGVGQYGDDVKTGQITIFRAPTSQ